MLTRRRFGFAWLVGTVFQVTFSEVSVGLTLSDMNITGGEAANLTTVIEGLEYTFDVVNMTDGRVTVGLFPGAIADPTGNVNVIRMF